MNPDIVTQRQPFTIEVNILCTPLFVIFALSSQVCQKERGAYFTCLDTVQPSEFDIRHG